jgi:hypothetical protein
MVKRYLKDQDPIGKRILIQQIIPGKHELGPEIPWQVVGVVADGYPPAEYFSLRVDELEVMVARSKGESEGSSLNQTAEVCLIGLAGSDLSEC